MTNNRPVHRVSTNKRIVAPVGVTVSVLACLAGGLAAPALAADGDGTACVPSEGTPAVFGAWTPAGRTDPRTDPVRPDDPDGEDGETNLLNVRQFEERHETNVPETIDVETTDWLAASPGEGWVEVDHKSIVVPAVPATSDVWTNKTWHNYTGNQPSSNQPPSLGDPKWHSVPADPQSQNHAFESHTPNVPYNVSNGHSGRGSWFLWTATLVPGNPGRPAETQHQYKYEKTTTTPGYTEYSWSVYERTNKPAEAATECSPEEPTTPETPPEPTTTPESTTPDEPVVEVVKGTAPKANRGTQQHDRAGAVPLSIDAGL